MQKLIKMIHRNEKGFTLVELMVVVVIIGILVAIAVPVYSNVNNSASRRAVEANLRTIDGAIMQLSTVSTAAPTTAILVPGYLQVWPTGPAGVASYGITAAAPFRATVTFSTANPYGVTITTGPHTLSAVRATVGW